VQVNGKVRSRITVASDVTDEALRELALADDATQKAIAGKTVRNVVIVPKRLVNVVVS